MSTIYIMLDSICPEIIRLVVPFIEIAGKEISKAVGSMNLI